MAGTKENEVNEKDGKIRLGKVEVKMGEKTVSLTVEQARELCALLKGLFGDDSTKIVHVHDYWYTRPWYMGPNWTYTGYNWQVQAIPCATGTTSGYVASNNASVSNVQFTLTK